MSEEFGKKQSVSASRTNFWWNVVKHILFTSVQVLCTPLRINQSLLKLWRKFSFCCLWFRTIWFFILILFCNWILLNSDKFSEVKVQKKLSYPAFCLCYIRVKSFCFVYIRSLLHFLPNLHQVVLSYFFNFVFNVELNFFFVSNEIKGNKWRKRTIHENDKTLKNIKMESRKTWLKKTLFNQAVIDSSLVEKKL